MKKIKLPEEIEWLIMDNGVEVRGYSPKQLLSNVQFYEMRPALRRIYQIFQAHIWGGCYKKNEVQIDPDCIVRMKAKPRQYADEVWHELVHNAQRLSMGDAKFNWDYAWGFIRHFGFFGDRWKRIYLEKEAFAKQADFMRRVGS